MKFKKASIFTKLVIAALMMYALISLVVVHQRTAQLQDRAAALQQQVSEMTQSNAELQYQIDHSDDDDMRESVAREKLGLVKKFGAFVSLPDGKSGLVHISEIANTYVSDVNEFLKLGDKVKVRVLAVTPDGKINLSIKKAEEAPARPNNRPMNGGRPGGSRPNNGGAPRAARPNRRGRSAARAGTPRSRTGSSSSCRSRTAAWPETVSITTVRAAAAAAETDAVKSRAGASIHEI